MKDELRRPMMLLVKAAMVSDVTPKKVAEQKSGRPP